MGDLLTKQQLAKHLQVSEQTIDRMRKKGLPYTRAGVKLVRFDLDAVNEWMETRSDKENYSRTVEKPNE